MTLGEPDASGRRRPVAVAGSDFTIECSTVIAAIGQSVERALAEREGLRVTAWGIAADERTLATNLAGVFAGGDAVLGADLAVRAVAAGRIAASLDRSVPEWRTGDRRTVHDRHRHAAHRRRGAGRYFPRHREIRLGYRFRASPWNGAWPASTRWSAACRRRTPRAKPAAA